MNRDALTREVDFCCYQGLKHTHPFIEDGVEQMAKDGIKAAIDIQMSFIESYHLHPKLIQALSTRVSAKWDAFEEAGAKRGNVRVLFSAHSLPARILDIGPFINMQVKIQLSSLRSSYIK